MAEAALLQKIKKDILSCYICSTELKDPIGLPCLHGFCFECLETWHQDSTDKTQVICPACKKSTPVPKEGIGGFPRHFLVHNLQDTMDEKSTEPTEDIPCLTCGKKVDMHCIDCQKSLCQQCLKHHNEYTKDHHMVTIAEFQSGQISTEGRICPLHGEKVRYYCETEDKQVCMDCISLKTCPIEHVRVALKEAAKKQADELEQLMKKCADNMKRFQDAIKDSKTLLGKFKESVKEAKLKAVHNKEACKQQVDQAFNREMENIDKIEKNRIKEIKDQTQALESGVGKIKEARNQVSHLAASNSDYLITYKYSCLSRELNQLSLLEPGRPATCLASLEYEAPELSLVVPEQPASFFGSKQHQSISMADPSGAQELPTEKWRFAGSFPTNGMTKPCGIATDNDGDIVITSYERGVKVYSRDGKVKQSFMEDSTKIESVSVSHDNRYIIDGGSEYAGIRFLTKEGKRLTSKPVLNINNEDTWVTSTAIDANDRIITTTVDNTVSIHYADGSVISKFARTGIFRVVPTSEHELVRSTPSGVELMDYSGNNVRLVQPPPEVKKWVPSHLCSTQGEIFVLNTESGYPAGIYRYTSKGDYLGCVTTDVHVPRGIAVSRDGMRLFLAEYEDCVVKIFERE